MDELTADPVANTLLQDTTGLDVHVGSDGWWAWRRSAAGWSFAIGRAPNSGPWYFDDATPPTAAPPSTGWRLNDDGNWSGDCYWWW